MSALTRRLDRLETIDGEQQPPAIAWRHTGETHEQARARWQADHPDEDPTRELLFVSWLSGPAQADNVGA
jgi:hypothetical protein